MFPEEKRQAIEHYEEKGGFVPPKNPLPEDAGNSAQMLRICHEELICKMVLREKKGGGEDNLLSSQKFL